MSFGVICENLIELLQRFRETAERDERLPVLPEDVDISRIEPLGFLEIGLALAPIDPGGAVT